MHRMALTANPHRLFLFAFLRTQSRNNKQLVRNITTLHSKARTIMTTAAPTASMMGLKQLFDADSSTYTYLLWDTLSKDAILVDPVDLQVDRDIKEAESLGLKLIYGLNTHAHADHITGTHLLKKRLAGQLQSVISEASKADADIKVRHGDRIMFGDRFVEVRSTPGKDGIAALLLAHEPRYSLVVDASLYRAHKWMCFVCY